MASNLELHEINFRSLSHPGGDGVSGVCVCCLGVTDRTR